MAIRAAFKVWPSLIDTAQTLGVDTNSFDDDSWSWLIEKLCALSSITQQGNSPDKMLGCDAVFLVRVLLEEQLLDGGRSNGRGGKYGGRFHPGALDGVKSDGSVVGSRPLTVGELMVNWRELREVMQFKYPYIDEETKGKKDPMPVVRQVLREMHVNEVQLEQQSWHPIAYDALFEYQNSESNELRQNSILLLGHEAQLPIALTALATMDLSYTVETDLDRELPGVDKMQFDNVGDITLTITSSGNACDHFINRNNGPSIILVVPKSQEQETPSDMVRRIVFDFNAKNLSFSNNLDEADETNIFVVHSSLDVLGQCKLFLDDDPPILSRGVRKCFLPGSKTTSVNLLLPEWADNIHLAQKNDAEMDPWMNILTETQFLESITAKIVSTK